jgi:hypothetical protein
MVHVGAILKGCVVVLAYLGGEPLERRHDSFTVIGLAFILLDVYSSALDVHGIASLVQLSLYGFGVAYQVSEGVAVDVFGYITGEVA